MSDEEVATMMRLLRKFYIHSGDMLNKYPRAVDIDSLFKLHSIEQMYFKYYG